MVEEYFETVSEEPDWAPRYNIAPTQPVPVIRQHPKEPGSATVTPPLGIDPFMCTNHTQLCAEIGEQVNRQCH